MEETGKGKLSGAGIAWILRRTVLTELRRNVFVEWLAYEGAAWREIALRMPPSLAFEEGAWHGFLAGEIFGRERAALGLDDDLVEPGASPPRSPVSTAAGASDIGGHSGETGEAQPGPGAAPWVLADLAESPGQ